MKKRILSILLTLCMVLCLVPITVFAAGGAKAILPGTSAQSILKIDKSRLSFAGHEWWVIGQKTDKSNNAPIITLLAVNNDFGDVPFRTGSAVPFENASRYSEDNGYYANNPSDMSQWRKPNEYAGSTLQQKMVSLAEAIPEKEQAVIRPKDITEGITGQEVKAQKLWAFSQEDSIYLYRNSCKYAAQWWTRSSNEVYGYGSWTIHPDGRSGSALNVDYDAAVRPAMELDLSSVLFISAAEHGKVADLTTPIAEYAGDEWKLTLHDSDRDDFTAKTVLVNGSVLEVEYKNAKVGDNEYISAVIKDADGSISRYTRVVQLDGTTNGTRGRAAIDLTGIDMTGKTLCVFNEQFNGDHKTDYAGALREVKLTDEIDEQFTLTPGDTYYFDLSGANIPGTANGTLPDSTLHYVPFTYAGTVDAYKLTSAMATTEEYAQQNKYAHSLFVADYAVTHTISWGGLNDEGLIFGKNYASGGVDYTLRAPSVGSNAIGSGDFQRGVPQSNEWDTMLNKNSGYIQNWNEMYSWGQDAYSTSFRAVRGYYSARHWDIDYATISNPYVGFRPVLEVPKPDTLGPDGLKVVTLDLGGGKLGGSSDAIQIIVKNGSEFTAPASGGLTRPDGNTGSYFMWLGNNGKLYAPGGNVPADVTKLTVQFALSEQFSLKPGGTYYFDLSAMGIPGTVNDALPDNTLHYVPFTYAGTVDAYKLMSEMATTEEYAQQNKYAHSLFVADYAVTNDVSWDALNTADLIFGKNYASGGVGYTLRAPSVGSDSTGWDDSQRGVPQSNEWDTMLNKNSGYIQNWNKMYLWGQDTFSGSTSFRALRGFSSARFWINYRASTSSPIVGFRPVLEVLNADTLGSGGLKAVTLDLGGGTLGNSSEDIHIIVKTGSKFTAPASDGMTRPDGNTGSYFMWLDGNGKSYEPGDSVPADVTELTVQWTAPTYTVTLHANGGTINNGNVTEYTYGVGATLPTDVTRTGYTFKGWYYNENLTGSPVTAIGGTETGNKEYWAKWEINQYTVTVKPENGEADITITQDYGTPITAPTLTREGYQFNGWDKAFPTTMPAENLTITAQWRDIAVPTGEIKIAENGWKSFFNTITFGLFFKDTQMVTVTAADNSGEAVKIEYLLSDKALTESELAGMTFTAYSAPFSIDPDNEYVIYAKLTDTSGNVAYINTNGIVLDATVPVISGIEAGKTYCAAQTVTITEKYVDTVTVNGTEVTLDENGSFVLSPADGGQKIVVTDKADNTAEMTVTVNDGHTFGEWTSNGDGTHTRLCTADGCTEGVETDNCTDEDKNHICDICGNIISNHEDANQDHVCDFCGKAISNHEDADKNHVCDICGKVISNHEDADKDHICDFCGKAISNHEDADNNHICDYCEKIISNHEDADKDHICDCCGKVISNHEDADKNHVCDICGKVISNHEDADKDHVCNHCGKVISNHEDADNNHICDYCEKAISNHEDADKDHVCDYCGKVITNHIGGKETCRDKAVCEVCGRSYGELDPNNHTDLKHFPAKAATEDSEGNIEYWYCSGCGKYYSDKDGTKEIAKADTVTAKLPKSPPTGDTSNLALWIALLFISGGAVIGTIVVSKKKRHSVE